MMDRLCTAILEKTGDYTAGRYVIFSEDELLETVPEAERSAEELNKALNRLLNDGYIDVKYSGGNLYCIAPLKKYVPEIICEPQAKAEEPERKTKKPLPAFWSAFLGGALGSFLVAAVSAILGYAF